MALCRGCKSGTSANRNNWEYADGGDGLDMLTVLRGCRYLSTASSSSGETGETIVAISGASYVAIDCNGTCEYSLGYHGPSSLSSPGSPLTGGTQMRRTKSVRIVFTICDKWLTENHP
jgi:hypothetical protein